MGAHSAGQIAIMMPVVSVAAACDEPRVVPQGIGRTDAAERCCARSDPIVGAYSTRRVAMPVAILVAACGEPRVNWVTSHRPLAVEMRLIIVNIPCMWSLELQCIIGTRSS